MFVAVVGALVYEIIMIHNSYQQYKEVDDTNNEIISTYTKYLRIADRRFFSRLGKTAKR